MLEYTPQFVTCEVVSWGRVADKTEFSFNRTMFRQIDGFAIGSPLGTTLAIIFVGFFEKRIPTDEWPLMYDCYVDDVFSFFVSKAKSAEFFERLNSLHPVRFTVEGEENGSLSFLDVRATKTATGIVISIFRNPTSTGLYTLGIHLAQRCIKSILSARWHTGLFDSARQRLLKVS